MPCPGPGRPRIADVVDAPHDLFEGDTKVADGLTAERVRTNVRNANYQNLPMTQEPGGTIRILTRRYVPHPAEGGTPPPPPVRTTDRNGLRTGTNPNGDPPR